MRKGGRLSHPIQLNGFHHVAYRCKDDKETVEFYQNLLGMRITANYGTVYLIQPGLGLATRGLYIRIAHSVLLRVM
ncbi:VOC family protein [Neptunomonas qingdaonensis]|uniref:VOC family protein n=1 Tax=Neptunomonas qingdaonensis TaxID=1045558 RepID=UPI002FC33B39